MFCGGRLSAPAAPAKPRLTLSSSPAAALPPTITTAHPQAPRRRADAGQGAGEGWDGGREEGVRSGSGSRPRSRSGAVDGRRHDGGQANREGAGARSVHGHGAGRHPDHDRHHHRSNHGHHHLGARPAAQRAVWDTLSRPPSQRDCIPVVVCGCRLHVRYFLPREERLTSLLLPAAATRLRRPLSLRSRFAGSRACGESGCCRHGRGAQSVALSRGWCTIQRRAGRRAVGRAPPVASESAGDSAVGRLACSSKERHKLIAWLTAGHSVFSAGATTPCSWQQRRRLLPGSRCAAGRRPAEPRARAAPRGGSRTAPASRGTPAAR